MSTGLGRHFQRHVPQSRHRQDSSVKGALLQKQDAAGGFLLGTNESGRVYFGLPEGYPLFSR
jgi:hypothetical protein